MGPPCDASSGGIGNGEGTGPGEKLHEEPEAEYDHSWNFDNLPEKEYGNQCRDTGEGMEQEVGSQNTGDGSTRANAGDYDVVIDAGVDEPGSEAGQQVEHQEPAVSQAVFHIVAEYPEVPHVANQMQPTAVQEHGREVGNSD